MTAQTETCQADLAALRASIKEQLGAAKEDFEVILISQNASLVS